MTKKSNIALIASIVFALAAVAFRSFQLLVTVDYGEMGFFSTDAGFFATNGLYVLLAVAAAVLILGAILDKKKEASAFTHGADTLTPKQTMALGIVFLLGACLRLYDIIFNFKGISVGFFGEALIFAVFAAIGFMIISKVQLKPSTGYFMLVIAVSYTLKAADLFMGDTVIVRVSDELILLLSYVASVLLFLSLGRFISANETKFTRLKLVIFGGAAAIISACASLSGYIALIIDSEYMKNHMATHPVSQIGTAAIAFTVLAVIYGKKRETDDKE